MDSSGKTTGNADLEQIYRWLDDIIDFEDLNTLQINRLGHRDSAASKAYEARVLQSIENLRKTLKDFHINDLEPLIRQRIEMRRGYETAQDRVTVSDLTKAMDKGRASDPVTAQSSKPLNLSLPASAALTSSLFSISTSNSPKSMPPASAGMNLGEKGREEMASIIVQLIGSEGGTKIAGKQGGLAIKSPMSTTQGLKRISEMNTEQHSDTTSVSPSTPDLKANLEVTASVETESRTQNSEGKEDRSENRTETKERFENTRSINLGFFKGSWKTSGQRDQREFHQQESSKTRSEEQMQKTKLSTALYAFLAVSLGALQTLSNPTIQPDSGPAEDASGQGITVPHITDWAQELSTEGGAVREWSYDPEEGKPKYEGTFRVKPDTRFDEQSSLSPCLVNHTFVSNSFDAVAFELKLDELLVKVNSMAEERAATSGTQKASDLKWLVGTQSLVELAGIQQAAKPQAPNRSGLSNGWEAVPQTDGKVIYASVASQSDELKAWDYSAEAFSSSGWACTNENQAHFGEQEIPLAQHTPQGLLPSSEMDDQDDFISQNTHSM